MPLNSAERTRFYRERKRQGVVCIAHIAVYVRDVEALMTCQRLSPDDQGNRGEIAAAVEDVLDDFTEGKLVRSGDG